MINILIKVKIIINIKNEKKLIKLLIPSFCKCKFLL